VNLLFYIKANQNYGKLYMYVHYACSVGLSFVDCGMRIMKRCSYS